MSSRRNKLNAKQISLLKLIYKFRFVTADLIAVHKSMSRSAVNYALAILVDQEYLGRRYDNSYKIAGKSAAYYLTSKSIQFLKESFTLNNKVLMNMYKNKTVSDNFIDEKLLAMRTYLALRESYPDVFNIYTPQELGGFNDLPDPKPSLYLHRIKPSESKPNDYVLDIISDSRLFIIKKRVQAYIEHCDSKVWGEDAYPTVLLVLGNSRAEYNVLKYTEPLLEDFDIYATTIKRLQGSDGNNNGIWSDAVETDRLIML